MTKKADESRLAAGETLVEPVEDENGRLRLDRRWTPEEAAAVEQAHRKTWLDDRARRFAPDPGAPA